MEKEKKVEKELIETVVVKEFPTQKVNRGVGDDGKEYQLITVEEALTEILNRVREIEKSVA